MSNVQGITLRSTDSSPIAQRTAQKSHSTKSLPLAPWWVKHAGHSLVRKSPLSLVARSNLTAEVTVLVVDDAVGAGAAAAVGVTSLKRELEELAGARGEREALKTLSVHSLFGRGWGKWRLPRSHGTDGDSSWNVSNELQTGQNDGDMSHPAPPSSAAEMALEISSFEYSLPRRWETS